MTIDPRAASGFAAVADAYERGRPSYPAEAIDRIIGYFELTHASDALDLAAGTGQLSRLLRRHVRHLVAVEPAAAMRTKIAASLGDVTAVGGAAESLPLRDGAVDAVVVGEAFHWFQTTAATAEIARVLKARGGVALLWNTPTWTIESTHWLDAFRDIVARHKRAAGSYPAGNGCWRGRFERTNLFEKLVHAKLHHAQTLKPTEFLAQVASWSWIANLEGAQRQAILDEVGALVGQHEEIMIPYRTDLYLARRQGASDAHHPADDR